MMDDSLKLFDAAMRLGRARDHITGSPATGDALLAVMDEVGIADALVWHADAQLYDSQIGNQQLMVDIAENPRLHACWVFMPHETGEVPHPSSVIDKMTTKPKSI